MLLDNITVIIFIVTSTLLQALQDLLSSDPDTQRQRMAELSRQIVALCVNEKTLSRRYTLLHETEASLRKVQYIGERTVH